MPDRGARRARPAASAQPPVGRAMHAFLTRHIPVKRLS